jgi:predicted nuclease with TOPRIM domain
MEYREQNNVVEELKQKIESLIELYENSKQQISHLQEENNKLKNQINQKDTELANLKEKYSRLELAKSIASSETTHDAKIKINRIVREIDNCISLLNK